MNKNIYLTILISFLILMIYPFYSQAYEQLGAKEIPPTFPEYFKSKEIAMEEPFCELGKLYHQLLKAEGRPRVSMDNYDAIYYRLDLEVTDFDTKIIYGDLTMQALSLANETDSIAMDLLNNMIIDGVNVGGSAAEWSWVTDADQFIIKLDRVYNPGEEFEVQVIYHGHPMSGYFGYFIFSEHNGSPIVWTLSEPDGAHCWWPCKDIPSDKATTVDLIFTVPDTMVCASEGLLIETADNADGTTTYSWHENYPISTYLVSLAATNYAQFQHIYTSPYTGHQMPIDYFVYPEDLALAQEDFNITANGIAIFAELFGEYPFLWEKYGMAEHTGGGAMEHQTCTTYSQYLIRGDHYYDYVLIHELAHMWWGDSVTLETWPDVWLNEGFASYSEALWIEAVYGEEAYHEYMTTRHNVNDPSGPIYDPDILFDGNTVYHKGAWVLHMLRRIVSDNVFSNILRTYAADPYFAYNNATTEEFILHCEKIYRGELHWFFEPWLYGVNRPEYEYSYFYEGNEEGSYTTYLHIDQVQTGAQLFAMPIDIRIHTNPGMQDFTVFCDGWEGDYILKTLYEPTAIELDPDNWILNFHGNAEYTMHIVTDQLKWAHVGEDYSEQLQARGGFPPYHWELVNGELPEGLQVDKDGRISGIPHRIGYSSFTMKVTDSLNPAREDERELAITVNLPCPLALEQKDLYIFLLILLPLAIFTTLKRKFLIN